MKSASTSSQETNRRTEVSKGPSQCFWALLSTEESSSPAGNSNEAFRILYIDPDAQTLLGPTTSSLVNRCFADFVEPDGRSHAYIDLARIVKSQTLFGSVIRCRFANLSRIRHQLSGTKVEPASASDYQSTDIVVNMVAERIMLCFFHAVSGTGMGMTGACGNSEHALDPTQSRQLWQNLYTAQPPVSHDRLKYVFQVLANTPRRQILFSWPPSLTTSSRKSAAQPNVYRAEDFAHLLQGIQARQAAGMTVSTSCTQRYRASHTLTAPGHTREISSVSIPYGSIVIACFEVVSEKVESQPSAAMNSNRALDEKRAVPIIDLPRSSALGGNLKIESSSPAALPSEAKSEPIKSLSMPQKPDVNQGNVVALAAAAASPKACSSCGKKDSPEWRRGPTGHKTLCNACGLRYARSLSNKRKRGKDGSIVTVEATGDPSMVPPSRGSGGGSRPGVHRRTHKRSATQEELDAMIESNSSQASPLASKYPPFPPGRASDVNPPSYDDALSLDNIPQNVIIAAAVAAAQPSNNQTSAKAAELYSTSHPAQTTISPPVSSIGPPDTSALLTASNVPASSAAGRPEYDAKTLDALLSNTILPPSHEHAPIFAALTQPTPPSTQLPLKKADTLLSVPMESLPIPARISPVDSTTGIYPTSDASHFPEMFAGVSKSVVPQQES
ncbi:hypothetical protein MYAM1_000538 [Malassezia yamatoensis]|uniref:GATA-type domain-containing protein n=1 Tax=Malassezia yamatoensis TaxID=253288 RepID=A0AAJ5YNX4_9BASI|nr:hypothetical protein MYAM1_000538 [Malassezia yamatoensis]